MEERVHNVCFTPETRHIPDLCDSMVSVWWHLNDKQSLAAQLLTMWVMLLQVTTYVRSWCRNLCFGPAVSSNLAAMLIENAGGKRF